MKKFFLSIAVLFYSLLAISQNPLLLKDVFPGDNTGSIAQIVKTSNYTFFNEDDNDADTNRSLFRTDGTTSGTIKLDLISAGYLGTKAEKLTPFGNKVVFSGDNSATYGEIWISDGTQSGTIALDKTSHTTGGTTIFDITTLGSSVLYGIIDNNNHTVLKKTDGTIAGTSLIYDFSSFITPQIALSKVINNVLYFNIYDSNGTGVDQLWRSDGTPAGTYMLKDFGVDQYVASWYMPANSGLFYWMIVKPGTGNVLWKSDGTIAGTQSVKTIGTTGNNNYPQFAATIGDNIAFAGLDSNGKELWTTDGTAAGTNMVADINPGTGSSNPSGLIFMNNRVYFSAFTATSGTELWESDGSASGTVLVKDINPGVANSNPNSFVLSNNTILFRATTVTNGSELWITDGTASNTLIAADINPGINASIPNTFTSGNPVYFAANNGVSGFEVFKYDNSEGILGAKSVWLTGAAFGEWKQEGVIKMTNNGGGIFTATNIQIIGTGGESSYFKFTEGTWATVAGRSLTTPAPGFPTGVTELSSVTEPQGVDNVITGTPGYWNVVYNYNTKAYSFTPTPPDNWGIVGTATPNGWNGPDMPLTYDASSNKWSAVVSLADGEIKFRNNNNWSVNYGDNYADGSLETNGANIAIAGGHYLITLDFNTLNYTIKSIFVAIPDPNFEQALIAAGLDTNGLTGNILRSDAEAVSELNVESKNINSLQGIEAFINLSKLFCRYNQIQVLDISNNKALTILECGGNQLSELNVSHNPLLKTLGFGPNNISQIDVSQNLNLEVFWCNDNYITSQNLDLNSKLTVIGLSGNPLAFVSLKNGNNLNVVYFEAYNTPNLACINADAIVSTSMSNSGKTFSENCSTTSLAGSWIIPPETGALKVGPTPGSDFWWYLSQNDIAARACYMDDKYVFNENGSFNNVLGAETYLEDWQGVLFQCGAPVAPHNGPNATYVYDQNTGTITLNGQGAYLGLPKAANGYELPNGPVPNSITYTVSFSDNGNVMLLGINSGGAFWTYKLIKEPALKKYYVNDNSKTGDVLTSAIGNNYNIGTKAAPFATLEYAIAQASAGETIYVDAGTYAEDVIVNKSITILGVQAGVNPESLLSRGAESVLVPVSAADPVNRAVIRLQASNITIDGLTVDGDNPSLTGSVTLNGVDINAGFGFAKLQEPSAHNNITIRNNIIKNFYRYGVFFQSTNELPLNGNLIENNHIDNISAQNVAGNAGRNGRGVALFNNVNATIKNNVFTSNFTGILLQGIVSPSAYGPYLITGNKIESYRSGITINNLQPNCSQYLVNENEITTSSLNSWNVPGSSTINNNIGFVVFSIFNTAGVNFNNNKINGVNEGFYFENISGPVSVNNNSITDTNSYAIENTGGNSVIANCNWYGSAAAQDFINKLTLPTVDIVPWLTNGTDNDAAIGFQPVPNSCDGYPTLITLDNYTDVTCNGSANGSINITTTYGKVPFNYTWTKEGDINFVSHEEDPTGLAPGTYHLALVDGNGSTLYITDPQADSPGTVNVTITEPSLLTATADGINNLCFGESTGTAFVVVDGGTAPYTYLWNNGATADEISNLSAGTYSVTVTDANGCTINASYEVTQPTLLTASITNNSTACSNNATVTANDGTPDYTYLWSNGATTASISNVPVGTYTVTITDNNGCSTTASITLTVGEAFNPSASVTDVSCFGGSNGTITVTNANGTAPFTFSKDGITFLSGTFPYSFNNLSAGTYNIAVKDANGCTGFTTKTIAQPALLTATIITVQSTCSGQSTGAISVATVGGSGALKYSWTGIGNYTSIQKNISGLAAGSYTLTVTDNNGCSTILNVNVPTYNAIVVNAAITDVLCRGSLTGAINLTVSGGSGSGFAYNWTGSTTSTSENISNLGAGTNYNVTITDIGSGCITTKSYVITQPASNLSLTTGKTNATGCGGSLGTITVTASGGTSPYEYKLDNGIYQSSGAFALLSSGSYTVWAKDANGCTSSKVVAITDNGSDQYESNNSKSQAKLISIGTTINARIALATDTADWFKFTPAGTGIYALNLSHTTVNYSFNMYAAGNNTPAIVPTSSTSTSKQYTLTAGTTYYVQITGGLSFKCYDLTILQVISPGPAKYASTNTKVISVDKLSVKAYPNPHQGLFNLSIISPEDGGKAQIELFSILGQLMAKKDVIIEKGQNTIVEFNDVGRGIILYHITIGDQEVNGKVYGKD